MDDVDIPSYVDDNIPYVSADNIDEVICFKDNLFKVNVD